MTEGSYSRRDIENLETIIRFCEELDYFIMNYGSEEEDFMDSLELRHGSVSCLEQIGEHVKRLSSELRDDHPEIDWKNVMGMRDFLVHRYAEINFSRVRYTVLNKIPLLEKVCRDILSLAE